jgi:serine phosphatase RsbU (regulator of sigma subunit)
MKEQIHSIREQIIRQVALFASLPAHEIRYLAQNLREREFGEGTVFIRQGEAAEHFFLLLEGQMEIIKELGSDDERLLGVGEPGSFVGELGLINPGSRRTASARARTPVRMLEMTRADFDALLHRQPTLAYKMVRVLSFRLENAENRTIRDLQQKNEQLSEAYEQLKKAQAQLVEKERLDRELELAREIQKSMLPRKFPKRNEFDFGARMVPVREVGGDFFDFISLPNDTIGVVIGDVSEKGVPAALFMALTANLVRAEARRGTSASETLQRVNRHLMEINDADMFVTVLFGVIDNAHREFRYARAGHEVPLLYGAEGELRAPPHGVGLPLGTAPEIALDEQTVPFSPGDRLLLYTDGVTDALDASGAHFGVDRLREAIKAERKEAAQPVCDKILDRIAAFRGEIPQYDDITLVAVQAR